MILIVGGQGAGKRAYAKTLGYAESDMTSGLDEPRPVLLDLHLLLRDGKFDADELFFRVLSKEVVVCNEVGCGVVPMDAAERVWRDAVGEICARLAARADTVVRICCGLPMVLKGDT